MLLDDVQNKKSQIAVVGSGYVGLPTAALFADYGFNVSAVDVNFKIIQDVNRGISPIIEPGLQQLISKNVLEGRLEASLISNTDFTKKDIIILSVQTPIINENKKPDLSYLLNALKTIGENIKKQVQIAICSTIPPGTMHNIIKPLLENLSKLKAETDFYLAYVPERIAPGTALKELVQNNRLVGGIGLESTKIIADLFRTVCVNIIETDALTAEIAKTAENTFRDVNIAFANQLALLCEQYCGDVSKVIPLANTHPRVKIHLPGPGVGGPCLTKDPYFLINNIELATDDLITSARRINDYMPQHILNLTLNALKSKDKTIRNSKIGIIGTAYKADVDDSRFSPSESVIRQLIKLGAQTIVYDPLTKETFGAKKGCSFIETCKGSDCIIIMTELTELKKISLFDIFLYMNSNPVIIDGKRIIDPDKAEKVGFTYYGIGYGKTLK